MKSKRQINVVEEANIFYCFWLEVARSRPGSGV